MNDTISFTATELVSIIIGVCASIITIPRPSYSDGNKNKSIA